MGLIWLIVGVRSRNAEDLVVRSARSASTSPSPPFGGGGSPRGQDRFGGGVGVEDVGLSAPPPVETVCGG